MKNTFLLLFLFFGYSCFGQETKKIFGTVSDGKDPIGNVNIKVLNTDLSTIADADGKYSIKAVVGDKLQYSYSGMRTISIMIEDVTRVLNPIMVPEITELDEVVVKAGKSVSQKDLERDYTTNENIIKTAFGYMNLEGNAGTVYRMKEKDITTIRVCILDLLNERFPGVRVFGDCRRGGRVVGRSVSLADNRRPFLFDVDGVMLRDAPIWLSAQNIKRVAVMPGLVMAARYGSLGVGGVIVINTIAGNINNVNGGTIGNEKITDRARLRNNFEKGKVLAAEEVATPTYLTALEAAASLDDAKEIYAANAIKYVASPYFFLDAYNYFYAIRGDKKFADNILEKNFNIFQNNAVILKALAYTYESQDRFKKANETYIKIFILRPNYAQSYLDMANSYRNIGATELAAGIYARYGHLLEEGFMQADTAGFQKIIQREFGNLLNQHKKELLDTKKFRKMAVSDEYFEGTRLVFEWNDSEAEFDLQFVNPYNQYHKWKHSLADNLEAIYNEKEYGHNTKEFLLDYSIPGTWEINVNYMGNKSLTPVHLKATIYYNYGKASQRKETKVFKLRLKNANQRLFTIDNSFSIVTN